MCISFYSMFSEYMIIYGYRAVFHGKSTQQDGFSTEHMRGHLYIYFGSACSCKYETRVNRLCMLRFHSAVVIIKVVDELTVRRGIRLCSASDRLMPGSILSVVTHYFYSWRFTFFSSLPETKRC